MSAVEPSAQAPDTVDAIDDQYPEKYGDTTLRVVHTDGTVDYIDRDIVGGNLESMQPGYFRSPQFIFTVTAQCLGTCVAYLGWVLPANTLFIINADLGPSNNISWCATVWTLGSSVGFLLVGRLSDMFGRKWMVMGTTILGLIGCIIASCAQNVETLIAANAFNGVAAAGQLSYAIVLGEIVPNNMRGPVSSLAFASSLPFAVFGPIIARKLIDNTVSGWRWSFYLGDILSVITLVLYYFFYHPPTYEQLHVNGKSRWDQIKELDYIGIFLFIAGCVLFLIGLSWGGTTYPWQSAEVLCTLIIGFFTLIAFIVFEGYFCKVQPLMPPRLFKSLSFVAICLIAAIGAMIYYSFTLLWPQIIQTIYTTDSTEIGWQSSVVGGGVLLGQILGGFGLSYLPKVKWQTVIASCISFTFITSMTTLSPDRWAATIALATVALVAIGFNDNVAMPAITLVVEPQDIGLAMGAMGSLRALGGAVAEALYSSVLNNKLQDYLPQYVTPAALAAGLPDSSLSALFTAITAGSFTGVPGINDEVISAVSIAVKEAYTKAFVMVFYTTIPFSVLYIVGSLLVPNMDEFLGNNVARKLQRQGGQNNTSQEPTKQQEV